MTLTRNFSVANWGGKSAFGSKRGNEPTNEILIYGGVALGVLAGAAVSTYMWRSRMREAMNASPDERAEKIIESCEEKAGAHREIDAGIRRQKIEIMRAVSRAIVPGDGNSALS